MTEFVLAANGALDPAAALSVLRSHAIPGAEISGFADARHTRLLTIDGVAHAVQVTVMDRAVQVESAITDPDGLRVLTGAVRAWFDLDTDIARINAHLAGDPVLGPLVGARPGLRVTRFPERFEAAVMIVLGQQVSLAAGRTFGGRLVRAYGGPGPAGLWRFPSPARLAGAPVGELPAAVGITGARARTLSALAGAVRSGLELQAGVDRSAIRRALLALPGIGPWTVEGLCVRALGDPDGFPASDLVLRRALGGASAAQTEALAERWRPWRAYALAHLWAAATAR